MWVSSVGINVWRRGLQTQPNDVQWRTLVEDHLGRPRTDDLTAVLRQGYPLHHRHWPWSTDQESYAHLGCLPHWCRIYYEQHSYPSWPSELSAVRKSLVLVTCCCRQTKPLPESRSRIEGEYDGFQLQPWTQQALPLHIPWAESSTLMQLWPGREQRWQGEQSRNGTMFLPSAWGCDSSLCAEIDGFFSSKEWWK